MRIPLFAHDANPDVDKPLLHKSRLDALELVQTKQAKFVCDATGTAWAVQFLPIVEHTLQAQLAKFLETNPGISMADIPEEIFETTEGSSVASITFEESQANVGISDRATDIIRARRKISAFPHAFDSKAVTVQPACTGCQFCR